MFVLGSLDWNYVFFQIQLLGHTHTHTQLMKPMPDGKNFQANELCWCETVQQPASLHQGIPQTFCHHLGLGVPLKCSQGTCSWSEWNTPRSGTKRDGKHLWFFHFQQIRKIFHLRYLKNMSFLVSLSVWLSRKACFSQSKSNPQSLGGSHRCHPKSRHFRWFFPHVFWYKKKGGQLRELSYARLWEALKIPKSPWILKEIPK